ncbi:riboflavin kinase domain-containing protein [Phthorimaea operculella]|nr:riboflavin kinase domain-containing protein [Phthorimaea operculella]
MTSPPLPVFLEGEVVKGFGRGSKQLGCPTANYNIEVVRSLPRELQPGVYCGWAQVDNGPVHKMVTNIGWCPFYQNKEMSVPGVYCGWAQVDNGPVHKMVTNIGWCPFYQNKEMSVPGVCCGWAQVDNGPVHKMVTNIGWCPFYQNKEMSVVTNYNIEVVRSLPRELQPGVYCGWAQVDNGPVHKMVTNIGWCPFYQNKEMSVPGVYCGWAQVDNGPVHKMVTNIGWCPFYQNKEMSVVSSFILTYLQPIIHRSGAVIAARAAAGRVLRLGAGGQRARAQDGHQHRLVPLLPEQGDACRIPIVHRSGEVVARSLPRELQPGVYCGWAQVDNGPVHKMVTNIGWCPFYQNKEMSVETHVLHKFDQDFYGSHLKIAIVGYLRGEKNFDSLDDLIAEIKQDIENGSNKLDEPFAKEIKNHSFFSS